MSHHRGSRWVAAAGLATAIAGVIAIFSGSAAYAASTISINPGNVPTTASGFGTQSCAQVGGPVAGMDGWVFVLPGNSNVTGTFTALFLTFQKPDGTLVNLTIPTDGGAISSGGGTSKAWIQTPAGWTLIAATANITGTASSFNLTHTCPAVQTPPSSPPPSSSSPPSSPPTSTTTTSSSSLAAVLAGAGTGGGAAIGLIGGGLFASTIALLVARRRRDAADRAEIENAEKAGQTA